MIRAPTIGINRQTISIYQVRKNGKTGCGIAIFIQKHLICKIRYDLSVNNNDTEALYLEIINQ